MHFVNFLGLPNFLMHLKGIQKPWKNYTGPQKKFYQEICFSSECRFFSFLSQQLVSLVDWLTFSLLTVNVIHGWIGLGFGNTSGLKQVNIRPTSSSTCVGVGVQEELRPPCPCVLGVIMEDPDQFLNVIQREQKTQCAGGTI